MKIYFLIYDKVEELDLVGSLELIGLLAEKGLCEKPKLISLNSMTPSGLGLGSLTLFHTPNSQWVE